MSRWTHDPLRRRSLSIGAVLAGAAATPLLVAAIPVLALVDLADRRAALPRARLALFGIWYLWWEVVAVAAAAGLWIAAGFGRTIGSDRSVRRHQRLQARWVASLLGAARRTLGLRLEVDGADALAGGPLLVFCRHASLMDTLIPAHLLFEHGMALRYVLKEELVWDPALDIIGHRLPNYFVDRASNDAGGEAAAIASLAAGAGDRDAVVIFPEGTRWSAAKRERAIAARRERDPDDAARAETLVATLPPRSRGPLAMLSGAPAADVAVLAHTGLEGLSGPKEAIALLPLRHPVRVTVRRIPRADLPGDDDARREWLWDQWRQVDDWVDRHRQRD